MNNLLKAMTLREELKNEDRRGSISNYFLVLENGEVMKKFKEACYSSLYSMVAIDYIVSYPQKGFVLEESNKTYIDYVLNRSPYCEVFYTKNIEEAIEGGVLINVDLPNNLVLGGMTALRTSWEFPHLVSFFKELVENGVSEDIAFLGAHCVVERGGEYNFENITRGHYCVDVHSESYAKNFVKRDLKRKGGLTRAGGYPEYGSVHGCWGGVVGKSFLEGKDGNIFRGDKIRTVEVWGGKKTLHHSTDLKSYAKFLIDTYMTEKAPVKEKKPVVKKVPQVHLVFQGIDEAHGFTPEEIARIKRQIRRILGPVRNPMYKESIREGFIWNKTPQGFGYWEKIYERIRRGD